MPFTFKLSKRLALMKTLVLILVAAALACDQADRSLTAPSHPSFTTTTGAPAPVTDLAVSAVSDTSVTLSFTEVDDGTGAPASYDMRSAVGSTLTWWLTNGALNSNGSCASPMAGTAIGAKRTCPVLGLTPGTTYSFELVAFSGTLKVNAVFGPLSNVATGQTTAGGGSPSVSECATPQPGWIWCDDFEQNRLGQYFEYDSSGGDFVRAAGVGVGGSIGMRVHFATGQVSAGALHLAMGKVPSSYFRTVDAGTALYRDAYWRMYVRTQAG